MMELIETTIKDCVVLVPDRFLDARGSFEELYNEDRYGEALRARGIELPREWRQVNLSSSRRNVVRGLHIAPFAKLVTCVRGEVYDVVVDCRGPSPRSWQWTGTKLSETNRQQVYVPAGCAHGFMALGEDNLVIYQQTATFNPKLERSFHWRDNGLGIEWPPADEYIVSAKDQQAPPLR